MPTGKSRAGLASTIEPPNRLVGNQLHDSFYGHSHYVACRHRPSVGDVPHRRWEARAPQVEGTHVYAGRERETYPSIEAFGFNSTRIAGSGCVSFCQHVFLCCGPDLN